MCGHMSTLTGCREPSEKRLRVSLKSMPPKEVCGWRKGGDVVWWTGMLEFVVEEWDVMGRCSGRVWWKEWNERVSFEGVME